MIKVLYINTCREGEVAIEATDEVTGEEAMAADVMAEMFPITKLVNPNCFSRFWKIPTQLIASVVTFVIFLLEN